MAKTVMLNSANTVWATTFWGGEDKGTCIDISMILTDELQVTRTFTMDELREILCEGGGVTRGVAVPSPDNEDKPWTIEELLEWAKRNVKGV
jgi:hypothetical protein